MESKEQEKFIEGQLSPTIQSKIRQWGLATKQMTCKYFCQTGYCISLDKRRKNRLKRFKLFLVATGLKDQNKIKACVLIYIGGHAYQVYKSLKKQTTKYSRRHIQDYDEPFCLKEICLH